MHKHLVEAFRYHRRNRSAISQPSHMTASQALQTARQDCAAYDEAMSRGDTKAASRARRYASSPWAKPYAAVTWQPDNAGQAFVEKPERAGLRLVGDAHDIVSLDHTGWLTDPHGDVFKDGTGLVWGVVFQLPGRDGKSRFVPGYVNGGDAIGEGAALVDFETVFEEPATEWIPASDGWSGYWNWQDNPRDMDACRAAARAADALASHAAEEEREYQTAWQAGRAFADLGEEIATERKAALELLAERRQWRGREEQSQYPAFCAMIRREIGRSVATIQEARDKREKLREGDPVAPWNYCFYPDARLRAAFNDGAGEPVFAS